MSTRKPRLAVSPAADRAKELVAERETLTLTPRDWSKFLGALDKTELSAPETGSRRTPLSQTPGVAGGGRLANRAAQARA